MTQYTEVHLSLSEIESLSGNDVRSKVVSALLHGKNPLWVHPDAEHCTAAEISQVLAETGTWELREAVWRARPDAFITPGSFDPMQRYAYRVTPHTLEAEFFTDDLVQKILDVIHGNEETLTHEEWLWDPRVVAAKTPHSHDNLSQLTAAELQDRGLPITDDNNVSAEAYMDLAAAGSDLVWGDKDTLAMFLKKMWEPLLKVDFEPLAAGAPNLGDALKYSGQMHNTIPTHRILASPTAAEYLRGVELCELEDGKVVREYGTLVALAATDSSAVTQQGWEWLSAGRRLTRAQQGFIYGAILRGPEAFERATADMLAATIADAFQKIHTDLPCWPERDLKAMHIITSLKASLPPTQNKKISLQGNLYSSARYDDYYDDDYEYGAVTGGEVDAAIRLYFKVAANTPTIPVIGGEPFVPLWFTGEHHANPWDTEALIENTLMRMYGTELAITNDCVLVGAILNLAALQDDGYARSLEERENSLLRTIVEANQQKLSEVAEKLAGNTVQHLAFKRATRLPITLDEIRQEAESQPLNTLQQPRYNYNAIKHVGDTLQLNPRHLAALEDLMQNPGDLTIGDALTIITNS